MAQGGSIFFNTYRGWAGLVVRGCKSDALFSKEGVTQGDPLSMFIYAIGSQPLIKSLSSVQQLTQVWYADDASAVGSCDSLKDMLQVQGQEFSYFPEPSKSFLVVDSKSLLKAKEVFTDIGVNVVVVDECLAVLLVMKSADLTS